MALLGWAAPLGRMAFTNYLAHSLIFGWIFYGYGLGLFGRLGVTEALAIGIAVYVAQVLFNALVAAPLQLRPCRVAVAHADVWCATADVAFES